MGHFDFGADMASLDGMGAGGEFSTASVDGAMNIELALTDGLGGDADEFQSVAPEATKGVFLGDEDGDGEMEIY